MINILRDVTAITLLLSAIGVQSNSIAQESIPMTPVGVTLVEILRELPASSDQYLGIRIGDAAGNTLFVREDSGGECSDDCAAQFAPFVAQADAKAFDDWSLVSVADGAKQWAYQSRLLFTWSMEQEPGDIAVAVALSESGGPASDALPEGLAMPPPDWRMARFTPAATMQLPAGIDVSVVASAQSVVLTSHDGMTLYTDVSGEVPACDNCDTDWIPLAAPALASQAGEFSVVSRTDGTRQWAYQGQPLYYYGEDLLPGDAHGRLSDVRWKLASVKSDYRPARVDVAAVPAYGDVLTLDGKTLYFGSAFEKYWGGRNLRGSFRVTYLKGKRLGGMACTDDECLTDWQPFNALQSDQSTGFWEVIDRDDGSKQWSYKGFALYTYSGDKLPGQIHGHSLYSFAKLDGSAEDIERTRMLASVGNAPGGAGVYWSIAKP